MRVLIRRYYTFCCLAIFSGCAVTGTSSKYNFADGYYYSKLNGKKLKKYYVVSSTDSIKVYPGNIEKQLADTVKSITVLFPPTKKPDHFTDYVFKSQSFDLDVITILFKYRPRIFKFPSQFNTNFNGAFYGGYRIDNYELSYSNSPLHIAKRKITHRGFSMGAFLGAGSARIDEFVTSNQINYEYDGTILTTGIATELAFNNLNFGIEGGIDFLTDQNRHAWVSEKKPWIGLSLGININ